MRYARHMTTRRAMLVALLCVAGCGSSVSIDDLDGVYRTEGDIEVRVLIEDGVAQWPGPDLMTRRPVRLLRIASEEIYRESTTAMIETSVGTQMRATWRCGHPQRVCMERLCAVLVDAQPCPDPR